MTKTYSAAGFYNAFYGFLDSAGYFLGAASSLSNGADSGAVPLDGVNTFNFQPEQPRYVDVLGNNSVVSTFIFPPASNPKGTLVLGVFNSNFAVLPASNKVYAVGSDWEFTPIQPSDFNLLNVTLLINTNAQSRDSGSVGTAGYLVEVYPKCQIVPRGHGALANAAATEWTHDIVANLFDTLPWGEALSASNEGTTKAVGIRFYSPYPCTLHAYKADGSTLTYTVDYTPAAASSDKVAHYKAGTKKTYTTDYTVTPSTKTITLVAAGTAGDKHVDLFQYDPTA